MTEPAPSAHSPAVAQMPAFRSGARGAGPCTRGRWSAQALRQALRVYAVTDRSWLRGRTLAACVEEALQGGATFVQLREKRASFTELAQLARAVAPLCRAHGAPFVIDDDVKAARMLGADGVHVGQSDARTADARRILGPDAIVGTSVRTCEEARAAEQAGADYLGVGAMFPTPTKPEAPVVSMDELRAICAAVSIPVVVIGGIDADTIGIFAGAGIAGAAAVSAIFAHDDIRAGTGRLAARVDDALGIRAGE